MSDADQVLGRGRDPCRLLPSKTSFGIGDSRAPLSNESGDLRAVVQIDQQPTYARMNELAVGPPLFQAIRHEVAGVSRGAKDYVELIVVNFQDSGRC